VIKEAKKTLHNPYENETLYSINLNNSVLSSKKSKADDLERA
jgi:hypothetical protein